MTRMRVFLATTALIVITAVTSLSADVKTEERMKFELGGMLGKAPGFLDERCEGRGGHRRAIKCSRRSC